MTDLATDFDIEPREYIQSDVVVVVPVPDPAFPAEQEVLFRSAAALAGSQVPRHRIRAAIKGLFVHAPTVAALEGRPMPDTPRVYPRHYGFIEEAAMARAMRRL
jgi:type IV secretory pathway protease TraF